MAQYINDNNTHHDENKQNVTIKLQFNQTVGLCCRNKNQLNITKHFRIYYFDAQHKDRTTAGNRNQCAHMISFISICAYSIYGYSITLHSVMSGDHLAIHHSDSEV